MAQKVYQLKYDTEFDKDIDTWLKGLPRSKKAEHVRHALRFYIAYAQDSKTPVMPGVKLPEIPVEVPKANQPEKVRSKVLGTGGLEEVN